MRDNESGMPLRDNASTKHDDIDGTTLLKRLMLGLAPDDQVPSARVLPINALPMSVLRQVNSDPAAREELVALYLEANPDAAVTLERDLSTAWQHANGRRGEYVLEVAKKRAEVLSRAELRYAMSAAPAATADVIDSLAEYLSDAETRNRAVAVRDRTAKSFFE